jgi:hypothetical protein
LLGSFSAMPAALSGSTSILCDFRTAAERVRLFRAGPWEEGGRTEQDLWAHAARSVFLKRTISSMWVESHFKAV